MAMSEGSQRARAGGSYPVLLGLLALMWGSSYLFIKIGVETLPPLSLVSLRLLVGLAILVVAVVVTRTPLPRDRRTLGHLAILGAVNIAIPFWLIGWAEQHISSGLTGILQRVTPSAPVIVERSAHGTGDGGAAASINPRRGAPSPRHRAARRRRR